MLIFCCKTSVSMLFGKKVFTCKILGDLARTREALRTDGRTDGHTRSQDLYMSPAVGDI